MATLGKEAALCSKLSRRAVERVLDREADKSSALGALKVAAAVRRTEIPRVSSAALLDAISLMSRINAM